MISSLASIQMNAQYLFLDHAEPFMRNQPVRDESLRI